MWRRSSAAVGCVSSWCIRRSPRIAAFVQFLVEVDDPAKIEGLLADIQTRLDSEYPNANAIAKKFLLGPGAGGRVQARFSGPDPAVLRQLANQAVQVLDEWPARERGAARLGEREMVIRPTLLESQARRNGITRVDVAQALQTSLEGRIVGFYREPGDSGSGTGTFPQETRLLPIVARPPLTERSDVAAIASMQIWSPVAGRMIPLSQVVGDVNVAWEDPIVHRRDRFQTITVHADPRPVCRANSSITCAKNRSHRVAAGLCFGVGWRVRGFERSRAALAEPIPYFLALMVFIVVCLFNSHAHHAPHLADHAAGDHRRHGRPLAHGATVRLYGPPRRPGAGGS